MSTETGDAPVEAGALRDFAGRFATGVAVLTTRDAAGARYGLTMNAIACVSLEPPLFLACVDMKSATLPALRESGVFALNLLAEGQEGISRVFATKGGDKFAEVPSRTGALGVPLIIGAVGSAEFRVVQTVEAGDHVIVIGEARAVHTEEAAPLLYFRGRYGGLEV